MRLDVKSSCFQSNPIPDGSDLFASRLMRQLPRFFSWRPDSEAEGTDAFSQDWSIARSYTNPPWCLIACCLSQIKRQMARVMVITPLWNTQPWFPTILGLLEDFPHLLQARTGLVRSRIHNEAGSSRTNCLAYLRESFTSHGISTPASDHQGNTSLYNSSRN